MELDGIAPDVEDKELRGADDTAEVNVEEKAEVKVEKPEAKAEEKVEEKTKFVPHEALHEERMKRKELAAKLEAKEKSDAEYRAGIESKLSRLFNPPAPKPDVEKEPVKALQHDIGETRESIKPLAERMERFEQDQNRARAEANIANRTYAAETEFLKKNPDYHDAIEHLKKVADANLRDMGIEDPAQRAHLIRQQSLGIAHQALQGGKDPAAIGYKLAQNYGYQAKKQGTEEKKLETIEKGQKESASLGGGGANTKSAPLTLTQLERMSDEEIDELVGNDQEWSKLIRQMK